jgi:predicted RNA-binding Zn ribbon-like protein
MILHEVLEREERRMQLDERPATGQQQARDGSKPFLFLGGNLALDLVNTGIMVRGKPTDLLVSCQDAARWWEMACQEYPHLLQIRHEAVWNEQDLAELRTLRQALRQVFEALVEDGQIEEEHMDILNEVLQEGSYVLEVSPKGPIRARYKARHDAGSPVPLLIASAALSLLVEEDLRRLHACQNEQCTLLFYDHTKSATRHWCSTACMNRARSRKQYQQSLWLKLHSAG